MIKSTLFTCSDLATQTLMEGAEDVLGADKISSLLGEQKKGGSSLAFADAVVLLEKLEDLYGVQGGRGLAVRIGRASIKYGIKQFGDQAGFYTAEFRLLPAPRRIATGLNALAQILGEACNDVITVIDGGDYWLWRSERCPLCRDRRSADPCCHVVVGLLQEFATWAGGWRYYPVTETMCRASGGQVCEYRIEKKPLD